MMRSIVCHLLLLAGLWWLLAGGDGWSWLIGGPVILVLAAWRLSDAGGEEGRLRLWRLPMLVPLVGGKLRCGCRARSAVRPGDEPQAVMCQTRSFAVYPCKRLHLPHSTGC
jgi:hypothetical protein